MLWEKVGEWSGQNLCVNLGGPGMAFPGTGEPGLAPLPPMNDDGLDLGLREGLAFSFRRTAVPGNEHPFTTV